MLRQSSLRGCCLLLATRRRKPSHYSIKAKLRGGGETNKDKHANHRKSVKQMAAMHFLKIIINGADQSSVSPPSGQDTKPHQSSDGQRDRGAAEAPRGRVNSPHTCCTNNHDLFIYFWGDATAVSFITLHTFVPVFLLSPPPPPPLKYCQ